jgi:hypothetical protein
MAKKVSREQVLAIVEHYMGLESASYAACVEAFEAGAHPKEILMHLSKALRGVEKQEVV